VKAEQLLKQNSGRPLTGSYLTHGRVLVVIPALGIALLLGAIFALANGSEHIAFDRILGAIWAKFTGTTMGLTREEEVIIFSLRLPRIALSMAVGAALAISGAAFQALLRNP
jgi:iron complex transport system permease protein